jgi:hypothetical protein
MATTFAAAVAFFASAAAASIGDAPYAAPADVMRAIDEQASQPPAMLRSVVCSPGEAARALDDAQAKAQSQQWELMRASQNDFAIEFALCALYANSQSDFENYSGFAASALTSSIVGDRNSADRSADYERATAARARTIATWLVTDSDITQPIRFVQASLLQDLDDLTL